MRPSAFDVLMGSLAMVLVANSNSAGAATQSSNFQDAVRKHAVRLDDEAALDQLIGDARIVALSEPMHCAAQPLEFRNQLFKYLVRAKGFTAIALESGLIEGRDIYDYVRSGRGNPAAVLKNGLSWTFDTLPQNEELIRWMRDYNLKHPTTPINFYGFDIPGSPGNPGAARGMGAALAVALDYLKRVDQRAAFAFKERFAPYIPDLKFALSYTSRQPGYHRMDQGSRDRLTAAIADLNVHFDRHQAAYVAASSDADYAWGRQVAIGARQTDAWAREIPVGWSAPAKAFFLSNAVDVRDRAMVDNLDWLIEQEGQTGKILVFGHRYHLSAAPVIASWWPVRGSERASNAVMGTYLRRRFGDHLLTIGAVNGVGTVGCGEELRAITRPLPQSIEARLASARNWPYLLDLRMAPANIVQELGGVHDLGQGDDAMRVNVGQAFDVLYNTGKLTPAVTFR